MCLTVQDLNKIIIPFAWIHYFWRQEKGLPWTACHIDVFEMYVTPWNRRMTSSTVWTAHGILVIPERRIADPKCVFPRDLNLT